jgi:hypothetical protein
MTTELRTPPYASYVSFQNFFDNLKAHPVLPDRIDKSVMSHLNNGTRAALFATLKSLQLINDDGTPTEMLVSFVHADKNARKPILAKMLKGAFPYLWDGGLNLERATSEQVLERIRTEGKVSGSTVGKVMNFLLLAAADAGVPLSPHLSRGRQSSPANGSSVKRGRPKRQPRVRNGSDQNNGSPPRAEVSDPVTQLMNKFPQFDPQWSDELKAKWFEGFGDLMERINPPKGRKRSGATEPSK